MIDRLSEAGIPSVLFHQNASGGLGDLPVIYPEVWIKRDMDLEKAIGVINRFVSRRLPPGTRLCRQCGESNPATFEICWQCLTPLAVSATD
ncbi:DUF7577 domain-containing protein [Candidatus Spongiihabitans sp.]|uniref:DUF7577 domain-containing protein n=1 Tax=Candidatus Spongiihabitans sp. TaxID=3101308 RepID=UPI003C79DC3F